MDTSIARLKFLSFTWPNRADLAPGAMYKEIRRCGVWHVLD